MFNAALHRGGTSVNLQRIFRVDLIDINISSFLYYQWTHFSSLSLISFLHPNLHTHRDTGSSCSVTHSQDGDILGSVQPPNRCLGLADPLHHGHIMFPVKNIIIALVI